MRLYRFAAERPGVCGPFSVLNERESAKAESGKSAASRSRNDGLSPTGKAAKLGPVGAVEGAVLDGLAEVLGLEGGGGIEVGDGAGDFEDAVMGTGGEAEAGDGVFEELFAFGRDGAVLANEPGSHLRVGVGLFFGGEALALLFTGGDDAGANGGGIFAGGWRAKLLVFHGGDFDVDINAVEKRAGNFGDVALDHGRSAVTFARGIAEIAARAGVHGGSEHEARRKGDGDGGAGNGDGAIFEGLAHDFENVALEFGEFVEKEDAVVAEGDFAGTRDGSAADESGIADGVMRRAKRASADEAAAVFKDSGNAVDTGGFDGFLEGHGRKNGGDALGKHGFAGAGRSDEKDVVAAGAGDFEGALCGLLAVNVAKIDAVLRSFAEGLMRVDFDRGEGFGGIDEIDGLWEGLDGENFDAFADGGIASVGFGDGDGFEAGFACGDDGGKSAANGANASVERQFAEEHHFVEGLAEEVSLTADQAESHGEVEAGAFFAEVGGSEIDGDALAIGEFEAAVAQGALDAFAAFLDGVIGKADDVEILHASGADVDLDFDEVGIDAVHGGADGFEEHDPCALWIR